MNTEQFLAAILPSQGVYISAEVNANGAWIHRLHYTTSTMATAIQSLDSRGATVYHACASYNPPETNKVARTAANAAFVRSQWLDIDCGPSKEYADQREALAALAAFCDAVSLPRPLVVSSGRGIHAYWTFTEDVPASVAVRVSQGFRTLMQQHGLKADNSRTCDLASVLRPVGSTWRKEAPGVTVRALNSPTPMPFLDFARRVSSELKQVTPVSPQLPPPAAPVPGVANAFAAFVPDFPPSSAPLISTRCPALAAMVNNPAAVQEPAWRAMLGLVKHTIEGAQQAHAWSQGHPGYTFAETQDKIDRWQVGPPKCEQFALHCGECSGCNYRAKQSSPIHLGYEIPAATDPQAMSDAVFKISTPLTAAQFSQTDYAFKMPGHLPFLNDQVNGQYRWNGRFLTRTMKDADGNPEIVPFATSYFYPYGRTREEDGTSSVLLCAMVRPATATTPAEWRTFTIPSTKLADAQSTATALAAYEVFSTGKNGKFLMSEYIKDVIEPLKLSGLETVTHRTFGWAPDGFVIGKHMVTNRGDVPVLLGSSVSSELSCDFGVRGTAQEWAQQINDIYNVPGAEPYQFMICAAFGAPLIELMGFSMWHGVPIAITGKSGLGKTTTAQVACSLFGDPSKMLMTANAEGATLNGLMQRTAVMRNLPFVMDEMTGRSVDEIKSMLYGLSNGVPKVRVRTDGTPIDTGATWNTVAFITGNINITELLAQLDPRSSEATQLRCFEILLPDGFNDKVFAGMDAKAKIENLLHTQYGAAGREYLRYLNSHRDEIRDKFVKLRQQLGSSTDLTRERFFYDLIATSILGGAIARKLGLLQFDLGRVAEWAKKHTESLRGVRYSTARTAADCLHDFVTSLHGRVVTTRHYPDGRTKQHAGLIEMPLDPIRGEPAARMALDDRRFIVTAKAFIDWCTENKLSAATMREEFDKNGYFVRRNNMIDPATVQAIFKATTIPGSKVRVYELDFNRVGAIAVPAVSPVANPVAGAGTP